MSDVPDYLNGNGEVDGPVDLNHLYVELRKTRIAMNALRDQRTRDRKWAWATRATMTAVIVVAAFAWNSNSDSRARDDAFARDLYMYNCQTVNEGRERIAANNIDSAENLIELARSGGNSSPLLDQYLSDVRDANAKPVLRDCAAEYTRILEQSD